MITGFGRIGAWFELRALRRCGPDVMTLAKGITSGYLPLGASRGRPSEICRTIRAKLPDQIPISARLHLHGPSRPAARPRSPTSTIIERERLPENAADVGAYLLARLREALGGFDSVGEIRGEGLMIGIELVADKATRRGFSKPHSACARVEAEAWERGLYVRAMGTEVVGLAPPLTIDRACADQIVAILAESIAAMEADVLARERARAARIAARRVDSLEAAVRRDGDAASIPAGPPASSSSCSTRSRALAAARGSSRSATGRSRSTARPASARAPRPRSAPKPSTYLRIVNGDLSGAEAFSTAPARGRRETWPGRQDRAARARLKSATASLIREPPSR